ncbi:MAG: 3-hydroxylacyl-ACP dehydratase [Burkholderiaceae bacterium]
MILLDRVEFWDENSIVCVATSHGDPQNPLRSHDRLPIICGVEYAAQAMALHGGLTQSADARPRAGLLASLRDCVCHVERLDTVAGELTIKSNRVFGDGQRVIYDFSLEATEGVLLTGRAAVVLSVAGSEAAGSFE